MQEVLTKIQLYNNIYLKYIERDNCIMEKTITYCINNDYVVEKGQLLKEKLQLWINKFFDEVNILLFTVGDYSSIIIDYEYSNQDPKNIKEYINIFLDRFNITYEIH